MCGRGKIVEVGLQAKGKESGEEHATCCGCMHFPTVGLMNPVAPSDVILIQYAFQSNAKSSLDYDYTHKKISNMSRNRKPLSILDPRNSVISPESPTGY